MLLSMLVLGVVLGAAGMDVVQRNTAPYEQPPPAPGPDARPPGFVAHMERTIMPRDSVQRAAIRPILEATDGSNRATVDASQRAMSQHLDSMSIQLAPLLDSAQLDRLNQLIRTLDRPRPHGGRPPRPDAGRPPRGG